MIIHYIFFVDNQKSQNMKQNLKFYLFLGLGIIINIQAENADNKGNDIQCVMKILFENIIWDESVF